jgi:hypothetical protein
MLIDKTKPHIPESYFEYRADFSEPMFELWTLPNPLVRMLYLALKRWNVGLSDIGWNKETKNYKDLLITFNVASVNATMRVGLDTVTFNAVNPDWSNAPALLELFEEAIDSIKKIGKVEIVLQEVFLALHICAGQKAFGNTMAGLVNSNLLGPAEMYGVSAYREDSSVVMDKSVRYEGGVFVRLQRKFPASASFPDVAMAIYEDETNVLKLLGVPELIGD